MHIEYLLQRMLSQHRQAKAGQLGLCPGQTWCIVGPMSRSRCNVVAQCDQFYSCRLVREHEKQLACHFENATKNSGVPECRLLMQIAAERLNVMLAVQMKAAVVHEARYHYIL